MSRHSHWASIRIKKGALDKKRGKVFAKHAHIIEVIARQGGGDPSMNASLRLAIDNARYDNMPRENIERAIKKGTGELKADEVFEVTYEGYGPSGVALLIDAITGNKNRTAQVVRNTLQKHGGSLGSVGCTSFMFDTKGMIQVKSKGQKESDEMELIDTGAQDILETDDGFIVYSAPNELMEVRKKIEALGFAVLSAELSKVPKNFVTINDKETAQKILNLMDALDNEEDISSVAANFDMEC